MSVLASISLLKSILRPIRQVRSDSWAERAQVLSRDVNLFCWKRPIDAEMSLYLRQLMDEDPKAITFHTSIEELDQKIEVERARWDEDSSNGAALFWQDVTTLIRDFLYLSNNKSGTVHLKVIDTNACTKFHTDGYSLRLFTTYVGKGTEWLPEQATHRGGLGKSNEAIIKDRSQIQQMKPFEVGILKGELSHQRTKGRGIVHRSPEIEEAGEKRLILRIDI